MNKSVGLFAQVKGDPQVDRLIVWDYHVFLIHELSSKYMVYDFDSVLPFPCSFTHYFTHGLRWNSCLPEKLHSEQMYYCTEFFADLPVSY
uniref:Protein N-terminal glutamine amidohydrolase n=1 Tax=Trichobilharzia regenti TaxID=157069 RepID=A0AA85JNJ1_TRIRE|nr:unnamed protein product [Trichobilharzia regenti]